MLDITNASSSILASEDLPATPGYKPAFRDYGKSVRDEFDEMMLLTALPVNAGFWFLANMAFGTGTTTAPPVAHDTRRRRRHPIATYR